jgi:hypothetical protein
MTRTSLTIVGCTSVILTLCVLEAAQTDLAGIEKLHQQDMGRDVVAGPCCADGSLDR